MGSQLWHKDNERKKQAKPFFSPFDVDLESGPTILIPDRYSQRENYKSFPDYFDDTTAEQYGINLKEAIRLTGPAGTFHLADTSRLLHCGSRTTVKPRYQWIISFGLIDAYLPPEKADYLMNPNNRFARGNALILDMFRQTGAPKTVE